VIALLRAWTPAARSARRADAALARALPEIARAIARGCAAGLPLDGAVARAAEAVEPEAAEPLAEIAADLAAGVPVAAAFGRLHAIPGGSLVVGSILLHGELGGDLVRSLAAIAEGVAERERLHAELRAATAQARIAARAVPLAPLLSVAMLGVLAPEALVALFTTRAGLALLTVAGLAVGVSHLLVRRIARAAIG